MKSNFDDSLSLLKILRIKRFPGRVLKAQVVLGRSFLLKSNSALPTSNRESRIPAHKPNDYIPVMKLAKSVMTGYFPGFLNTLMPMCMLVGSSYII
jgi:hypothetical protein